MDEDLRKQAIRSLRKKAEFRSHLMTYALVNGLLIAIWGFSGAGYFWPVWPILGWGIGIVMHAFDTYGRPELSEDRIRKEMDRLRRSG